MSFNETFQVIDTSSRTAADAPITLAAGTVDYNTANGALFGDYVIVSRLTLGAGAGGLCASVIAANTVRISSTNAADTGTVAITVLRSKIPLNTGTA